MNEDKLVGRRKIERVLEQKHVVTKFCIRRNRACLRNLSLLAAKPVALSVSSGGGSPIRTPPTAPLHPLSRTPIPELTLRATRSNIDTHWNYLLLASTADGATTPNRSAHGKSAGMIAGYNSTPWAS